MRWRSPSATGTWRRGRPPPWEVGSGRIRRRLSSETDPDTGGRFTVKVYASEKVAAEDGTWQHQEVRLLPDSHDPAFQPIVLTQEDGPTDVAILAEFVQVID